LWNCPRLVLRPLQLECREIRPDPRGGGLRCMELQAAGLALQFAV
jgi:hypothetical protein